MPESCWLAMKVGARSKGSYGAECYCRCCCCFYQDHEDDNIPQAQLCSPCTNRPNRFSAMTRASKPNSASSTKQQIRKIQGPKTRCVATTKLKLRNNSPTVLRSPSPGGARSAMPSAWFIGLTNPSPGSGFWITTEKLPM